MSDAHRIELPDETRLWLREQLARIDQLQADRDRKRQEYENAPRLLRYDMLRTGAAMMAAGFGLFGAGAALATLAIAMLK